MSGILARGLPPYDLRDFVRWIGEDLEPAVRLPGPAGSYAGAFGGKTPALYGVADMACIRYTIGALQFTEAERREWAGVFQSFQNPSTGFFVEKVPTDTPLHDTAFALAALELFELQPLHPPQIPAEMAAIRAYLSRLDWEHHVYSGAHQGAALGAIYALTPSLNRPVWFRDFFAVCDSAFDPRNGMMGRNKPPAGEADQIGGTFAYGGLYRYFNRRLPYPERRIDAVLGLQQPDGFWSPSNHLWLTLDALMLMTRTVRYAPYRVADVQASARRAMDALMLHVLSPAGRKATFRGTAAVHSVTAAVSIAAELQQFFGADAILTEAPLRLVLDRRPFI